MSTLEASRTINLVHQKTDNQLMQSPQILGPLPPATRIFLEWEVLHHQAQFKMMKGRKSPGRNQEDLHEVKAKVCNVESFSIAFIECVKLLSVNTIAKQNTNIF